MWGTDWTESNKYLCYLSQKGSWYYSRYSKTVRYQLVQGTSSEIKNPYWFVSLDSTVQQTRSSEVGPTFRTRLGMRKISPTTSYLDQSRSWIKRPPDIIGTDLFLSCFMLSDPSISKIVWTIFVKIRYQIKKLKGTLTQVRLLMRHLFGLNHIPEESKSNLLFKKKFKKALFSNRPSQWVIRHYIEGSPDMTFRWIISDWVCRSRRSVYRLSKSWSKRLLEVCCSSSAAGQAQANIFIRRTSYFETWFVLLAFSKPPFILSQQNFPNQTKFYSQTNPTIWGPNLKYF